MATETPSAPTPNPTDAAPDATDKTVTPPADAGESKASEVQNSTLLTDGAKPEDKPKPDEGKPDEKPDAPAVPEKYDIKLGEGQAVDQGALEAMTPVFKELGLSQENAQKLVSKFADYAAEATKQHTQQQEAQFNQWLADERAKGVTAIRKEWGSNFDANAKLAADAYAHFGGPEVSRILKETGLGDHPDFLKMFLKIGPLIQEDKPNLANGANASRKPLEQVLYPTMQQH